MGPGEHKCSVIAGQMVLLGGMPGGPGPSRFQVDPCSGKKARDGYPSCLSRVGSYVVAWSNSQACQRVAVAKHADLEMIALARQSSNEVPH